MGKAYDVAVTRDIPVYNARNNVAVSRRVAYDRMANAKSTANAGGSRLPWIQ
jgi:hypothetical protein